MTFWKPCVSQNVISMQGFEIPLMGFIVQLLNRLK